MTPSDKLNVDILTDSVGQGKLSSAAARPKKRPRGRAPVRYRRPPQKKKSSPALPLPKELPLQFLKGVGPMRAQTLAHMGIVEAKDLAATYPRAWEDRRLLHSVRDAPIGTKSTLRGVIREAEIATTRSGLGMASIVFEDPTGQIDAVWYKKMNPRYDVFSGLRQQLQPGRSLVVYGGIEWGPHGRQLRVEDHAFLSATDQRLEGDDRFHFDRFVPVYTVPEEMSGKFLRTLVGRILAEGMPAPAEILPPWVLERFSLPPKSWAMQKIHFPESLIEKERARTRLAFEEFLLLETTLGLLRQRVKAEPKQHHYTLHRNLLTPFRQSLGFEFTEAQKRVIREIFEDMQTPAPMNRLLQGDVGSGKTLVALCAMLLAVENGGQAVLMAPTEILAEQHASTFRRMLGSLPVRTALLTGRQSAAEKRQTLDAVAEGKVALVIGTHALVQNRVRFSRLMLAVIDEQHRFGVEHRSLLREKGAHPDVLVMTATPIPRTLALSLYGDLDVSTLDQLPPGRTPVDTRHVAEPEAYSRIHQAVARGEQAYVVYPLVEQSDKVELKAAVQEAVTLKQSVFTNLRVGVLHGQLPSSEKESIMEAFRQKRLDVLVATSVIEVGIDVPNATVMAIQHAERFGLSTLHQLRGRVGRGPRASVCLLIAECRNDDARRRIEIMTQTNDGFRLSEEDLSMRGPGEVMGVMQHGLPEFRVADLVHDAHILQQARKAAEELLQKDPGLRDPAHAALKRAMLEQYASRWQLGSTG